MVWYINGRYFGMIKAKNSSQPVYQQVKNFLVDEMASGRLSPGMFLPSERSICEKLSVSRDTIRRALQDLEIQGYISCGKNKRPIINGLTGNLFSHNNNSIAFLTGIPFTSIIDRESNQLANVFLYILQKLESKKLNPSFINPDNFLFNRKEKVREKITGNYGAVVYYPGGGYVDDDIISILENCQSPSVVIEGYMANDNTNLNTVEIDNFQGGYTATDFLIKNGLQNIFHFTFDDGIKWMTDRQAGYERAMLDNNIAVREDHIIKIGRYHNQEPEKIKANISRSVAALPVDSGVFAINDQIAGWFSKAAAAQGKNIPEDYSLVGFDNIATNGEKRPTTISHMSKELGEKAAEIILNKMNSENDSFVYKEVINPKLIIRDSVKKEVIS